MGVSCELAEMMRGLERVPHLLRALTVFRCGADVECQACSGRSPIGVITFQILRACWSRCGFFHGSFKCHSATQKTGLVHARRCVGYPRSSGIGLL